MKSTTAEQYRRLFIFGLPRRTCIRRTIILRRFQWASKPAGKQRAHAARIGAATMPLRISRWRRVSNSSGLQWAEAGESGAPF
jgi:hypothetical protein